MSIAAMAKLIGKTGMMRLPEFDGITFPVEIQDARSSFGRIDVMVMPIGGKGMVWVSLDRITLPELEAS